MNKINGLNEADIFMLCCAFVNLCDDMGKIPCYWEDIYKKALQYTELFEKDLKRKVKDGEEE